MKLTVLHSSFAICRLDSRSLIPEWAQHGEFYSISKTADELSVVCSAEHVPHFVQCERGWRAFKVEGPLDFSLTGILASLANPLAEAGISIFAISTFDTDYLLVREGDLAKASSTLAGRGFDIRPSA